MLVLETFQISNHMNIKTRIFIAATCLLALAVPTPLFAAKGARKAGKAKQANPAGKAGRPGVLLKKYDTDKSGAIDGTEAEALRKAFDADKTGPLKHLDANNDGTLDDKEVAAIKARHAKGDAAKGGKRRKKNL